MDAPDIFIAWQSLAQLPDSLVSKESTVQSLRYRQSVRSIRGSGWYGHRVRWHPEYPLLCLPDEATWRRVDGTVLSDFGPIVGVWHPNGTCFLHTTREYQTTWYNFLRSSRTHKPDFLIDTASCHPTDTLILGLQIDSNSDRPMMVWDPEINISIAVEKSGDTYSGTYRWSPNGRFIAAVGGTKPALWVGLWHADGTLIRKTMLPTATVLKRHLRDSVVAWSADSTVFVIHGMQFLIWWDIRHSSYRTIALSSDDDLNSFCGVLWHPVQLYLAVVLTTKILLFNHAGTLTHTIDTPDGSSIATMTWHPQHEIIFMGTWNCDLLLWFMDGALLDQQNIVQDIAVEGTEPLHVPYYSGFHPNGTWLALTTRSYYIHLYQVNLPR